MEKVFSHHALIRAGAAAVLIAVCASGAFRVQNVSDLLEILCSAEFAANVILFLSPLKNEDSLCSLRFFFATACLYAAACIFSPSVHILSLAVCGVSVTALLSYQTCRMINKYSRVRLLLTDDALMRSVRDEARFSFLLLLLLAIAAFLIADSYDGGCLALAVVIAFGTAILVLQYRRARTGRTCFISRESERQIFRMETAQARTLPASGSAELVRMNDIYRRALDYMETDKAYLNPDLTITLAARDLGVNRTYLSRIINTCSENNFSQFVGKYRINYAVQMLEKNPDIKMMEVAMASGFRTVVSFNMVFKLNMKCTPSEYVSRH